MHHPDDVESAMQQSLDDLGTDYVDLYLMHWPVAWKRGEDLFPKRNGKFVMENIDIVDVCCTCLTCVARVVLT
jgi:alcohol dehydrogenase (NADP+)